MKRADILMQTVLFIFLQFLLCSCSNDGNDDGATNTDDDGTTNTDDDGTTNTDDSDTVQDEHSVLTTNPFFELAPMCDDTGGISDLKLLGTIDGVEISIDMSPGSDLNSTRYQTAPMIYEFRWEEMEIIAGTVPLTSGHIRVPEDQPGGQRDYCILEGRIGVNPMEEQPKDRLLMKMEITQLAPMAEDETCENKTIDAQLTGCIFRTQGYMPGDWRNAEGVPNKNVDTCKSLAAGRSCGEEELDVMMMCDSFYTFTRCDSTEYIECVTENIVCDEAAGSFDFVSVESCGKVEWDCK